MRLKNKQERLEYYTDNLNWIQVSYLLNGRCSIKKLKNYPIVKIFWDLKINNKTTQLTIGCYRINPDWTLENCYSMSVNQCVDLITKCDKER